MTLFLFSVSISLMILLPILLAVALRRRFSVPWYLFCVGMAAFVGAQLLHIPFNNWLTDIGILGPVAVDDPTFWRTAVLLGFSAGLFEMFGRLTAVGLLVRAQKAEHLADGIMIGLGHGGIESMLFGGVLTAASLTSLLALQGTDLATLGLNPERLAAVSQQLAVFEGSPVVAFAPLLERGLAISLHVFVTVLTWLAFKRRNPLYLVVGVLYHALFDFTAVVAPQYLENVWLIEGLLLLLSLPALFWLRRRWSQELQPSRLLNPPGVDLALFGTAFRKELQLQWRTKQLLVVCVVFILFGLTSPLLAKFTPELLKSIEGAEQFAGLIPEPTTADALAQYLKNITQFGFLLVIILGMGAVAGEKEKGTASLILSKPLTRWSFVLSKFLAQSVVYLAAVMLGALGAYYYTTVLFDGLALAPFLFGNVLLWLWLLIFAAVTLVGSTLAQSQAIAAGIALLGSVLLFMAGTLPQIGALMPSGLIAWAGQLGLDTEIPANGGAIAMGIVLVLIGLLTAVAIFEEQEL